MRTLGWRSSRRTSSPPAMPAAPMMPTRMVALPPMVGAAEGLVLVWVMVS